MRASTKPARRIAGLISLGAMLSLSAGADREPGDPTAAAVEPAGEEDRAASPGSPPPPESVIGEFKFDPQAPGYRVQVDLAPEGSRSLALLLDTGATDSVVTPLFARKLGVSVRRTKDTPYRRATSLGRDLQFWVDTRSSDTGSRTGWEYGVLGGAFLDDYVLEIDYPKRVVRFLDPKLYEVPESVSAPDERVVPLRIQAGRPFVDIEINGEKNQVLLDTGAPDNVVLSGSAAKKFGIDWKKLTDLTGYAGVMGKVEVRLYESDRVRFADFDLEPLPVIVAPKGWFNQGGNTDSVVGHDILRQFVLRIDYPRRRLWLKRSGDTRTTYTDIDYALIRKSGAYFRESGRHKFVIGVVPGSPADTMGVRPGDVMSFDIGDRTIEDWVKDVTEGTPVLVSREVNDVYLDIMLPEDEWAPEED